MKSLGLSSIQNADMALMFIKDVNVKEISYRLK